MDEILDQIYAFYPLDSSTVWLILLFSCTAAYFIKDKLNNPASVVLLAPLFAVVAFTTYALAVNTHLFSPKRTVEWIAYACFSASIGAVIGIFFVALMRQIQDRLVTLSHIRQTLRRDAEQEERGYPAVDIRAAPGPTEQT